MILTTTRRAISACSARYTTPIPPSPGLRTRRNCPAMTAPSLAEGSDGVGPPMVPGIVYRRGPLGVWPGAPRRARDRTPRKGRPPLRTNRRVFLTVFLSLLGACEGPVDVETFEGTVAHVVQSRPETGWSRERYLLAAADGAETELVFPPAGAPGDLATGEQVRVRGRRQGGRLLVADLDRLARPVPLVLQPGTEVPARNILIVLVNFKNDDRQYYSREQVQQRVLTDKDSVRTFYEEQSYG